MTTALAQQGTQALSVPSHLHKFMRQEGGNDFGELTQSDIGISMLKVCQAVSPELGTGPAGEPAVPLGAVFNKRDRRVLAPGTLFLPLCRSTKYIKWIGKPGEGRMEFQTSDENDPRIKSCKGLEFLKNPITGETTAPLVTKYTNYYVYVQGYDEPLLLSFARKMTPVGRRMSQDLFRLTHGNRLPMWTVMFAIQPSVLKQEPGKQYQEFSYKFHGYLPETTPEDSLKRIQSMYEIALVMRDASTGAEFTQLDDDADVDGTALKNATPAVPAQQAPAQSPPPFMPPVQTAPQQVQQPVQQVPQTPPANTVTLF